MPVQVLFENPTSDCLLVKKIYTNIGIQSTHWSLVIIWSKWPFLVQRSNQLHPFFEFTSIEILANILVRKNFRNHQVSSKVNVVKHHIASIGP